MFSYLPSNRRPDSKRPGRRVKGSSGRKSAAGSARTPHQRLLAAIEPLEARMLMAADVPVPAVNFQFATELSLPVAERPYGPVDLMDLNNNGNQDIVFLGGGSVSVYMGDGSGNFTPAPGEPYKVTGGTGSHTEFYSMQVVNVAPAGETPLDAIIVSEAPRTGTTAGAVTVFLPSSTGSLVAMQTITGTSLAYAQIDSVAIGDINGDGIPDMVIASKYNRYVSVLDGNGNGTFQPISQTLQVGDGASSVVIADLEGRVNQNTGLPVNDIVVADNGDAAWSVLLNDNSGYGSFKQQRVFPANGVTYNLQVADINGAKFPNGQPIPDIVGTGPPANATAANGTFQPGGVVFTLPTSYSGPANYYTGAVHFSSPVGTGASRLDDLNVSVSGDGFDGLNVNYFTDTLTPLVGKTNGLFTPSGAAYSTVGPTLITNVDGTTANSEAGYGPVGATAGFVFNADNKPGYSPDIVVVDHGFDGVIAGTGFAATSPAYGPSITILRPKGNLKFIDDSSNPVGGGVNPKGIGTNPPTSFYPNLIAVGDVTGDGNPDIVTVSYNVGPTPATAAKPYAVASLNYPGTITILAGDGKGTFTELYSASFGLDGPDAVAVANVLGPSSNHDQIIVAGRYSGKVKVINYSPVYSYGVKSVAFSTVASLQCPEALPNTAHPVGLDVTDINGDGLPDIVVACYGTLYSKNKYAPNAPGQIQIFLNDGGGAFTYGQDIADQYGPDSVAVGVANGQQDLIVADRAKLPETGTAYSSGTSPFGKSSVSVLKGYNNGTFSVPYAGNPAPIPTGQGPSSVTIANLDPSYYGSDFALVLSQGSDSLSVLKSDGSGGFALASVYNFPLFSSNTAKSSSPLSLSVADVNGDGLPDVVVSYGSTYSKYRGEVAVLLNNPLNPGYLMHPVALRVPTAGIRQIVNPNTLAITYKAENLPAQAVVAVDVNGDNMPDLVVLTAASGKNYDAEVTTILQGPAVVPPTIETNRTPLSTTFTAGVAGTITFHVMSTPTSNITETGLPAGMGLTFTDEHDNVAEITGTPDATSGGRYIIRIKADNGYTPTVARSNVFVITLTIDQSPVITSNNHITFTAGKAASFTVVSTGFPADILSESGALPPGVSFQVGSNGTGTLSGTAADASSGGVYMFTFNATNGLLPSASQVFTLTINQAPTISVPNPPPQFSVGTFGSFNISTGGFPVATLTETGTLPAGVSFVDNHDGTATISGTPAPGTGKIYALTIGASNSAGTASAALSLTVGQPPVFVSPPQTATFVSGTSGTVTFTTSSVPVATLTELGALPAGVSFTSNGDGTGTLAGVPGPTSGGIYTFTVTASDGTLPNVTTPFTLTVGQAAQFISASHVTFNAGTAGSFRISTSGFPTASLREAGTLPAGVSFHDNGDGSGTISGTPPANGGNAYIVSITATNSIVGTASQVFTLTVNQPPAITSLGGASFSGGVSGSFTITSTGFPRPRFTVLSGSLPAGLNFQDNNNGTATISGTPVENTSSIDTIVISASNGAGPAVTQSFTVTVNALPVITNINGTLTGTGTLTGDTVNFSTGNGNLIATIDSVSASFPLTTVQALVISLANSTGNNTISIGAGAPVALVIGGSGNDTIIASNTARDTLEGGAGNDSIHAGGAKELLQGNSGNDTLIAGTGNDTLVGGNGADSLYGGPGADLLQGGAGPDTIVTGGGINTLSGGAGHDSILGGSGSNLLDGGIGTDTIVGGSGDTITDVTPGSTILHSS